VRESLVFGSRLFALELWSVILNEVA